jgi:hypothetical protein
MWSEPMARKRHLFIIARTAQEFYEYLKGQFAGRPDVNVVLERRTGERRLRSEAHMPDRRQGERRSRSI